MADEIKEEKLDSPLVVHKKGDASYQEEGNEVSMQNTHVDEDSDAPTLERHRFKKEKKKKKLTAAERKLMIEQLTKEMKAAAKLIEFEHAAFLRDKIKQLEGQK